LIFAPKFGRTSRKESHLLGQSVPSRQLLNAVKALEAPESTNLRLWLMLRARVLRQVLSLGSWIRRIQPTAIKPSATNRQSSGIPQNSPPTTSIYAGFSATITRRSPAKSLIDSTRFSGDFSMISRHWSNTAGLFSKISFPPGSSMSTDWSTSR